MAIRSPKVMVFLHNDTQTLDFAIFSATCLHRALSTHCNYHKLLMTLKCLTWQYLTVTVINSGNSYNFFHILSVINHWLGVAVITCSTVVLQCYRRQAIPMEQAKIRLSVTLYSLDQSLPNLVWLITSATPTQTRILVIFDW